jgi:putative nucleotidyltransferase with HDIG domain
MASTVARPIILENPATGMRLGPVLGGLSRALDLVEGQPMGHAVRTTLIGMKIGGQLGLSDDERSALFYALLLKDLGGSSNSSRLAALFGTDDLSLKHSFSLVDWVAGRDSARHALRHLIPGQSRMARTWHTIRLGSRHKEARREMIAGRAERGAELAQLLSLPKASAEAIRTIDEHWDGNGMPLGLRGSGIPMLARIAGLAQSVEAFARSFDVEAAYQMAHARRGRWFDPVMVDCLDSFKFDAGFWGGLQGTDPLELLADAEPREHLVFADEHRLDAVTEVFAKVIDAKSPFHGRHSQNVAFLAVNTGKELGMPRSELRTLRRAALLHEIGTLGISNRILDKPSALDPVEVETMRQHTRQGFEILRQVPRFRQFAATASAHHEKLDGSGYHLGLKGEELGQSARILAVADICEALSADRPHRKAMPIGTVLARLEELVAAGHLCPVVTDALTGWFEGIPAPEPEVEEATSQAA